MTLSETIKNLKISALKSREIKKLKDKKPLSRRINVNDKTIHFVKLSNTSYLFKLGNESTFKKINNSSDDINGLLSFNEVNKRGS
jgi:hypothetical protein